MNEPFIYDTDERRSKCFLTIQEQNEYFTIKVRRVNIKDKVNCVELANETTLLTSTVDNKTINYFIYKNECFNYTSYISQKITKTRVGDNIFTSTFASDSVLSKENFEVLKIDLPKSGIVLSSTTRKCCTIS